MHQGEKQAGRDSFAAQIDRSEGAGGVEGDEGDGNGVTDGDASPHVIYRKPEARARAAAGSG